MLLRSLNHWQILTEVKVKLWLREGLGMNLEEETRLPLQRKGKTSTQAALTYGDVEGIPY